MKIKCIEHLNDRLNYVKDEISKIKNVADNKLIILAPERYHFDLENIALDMTSDKSLSKVEVVSFARFIYSRLFEEGNYIKETITEEDEIEIIKKLFNSNDQQSYEILRLFNEHTFNDFEVGDKTLEKYNMFVKEVHDMKFDLSYLESVENIIKDSKRKEGLKNYLSNNKIVTFGFNDFKNIELRLLELLVREFNIDLEIVLALDNYDEKNKDPYDMNYKLYCLIDTIKAIFKEVNISNDNINAKKDDIKIYVDKYKDLHSECVDVCFKILNEHKNNNVKFGDMYILVNDLNSNKEELTNMLECANIPYSLRTEKTLKETKIYNAFISLLRFRQHNFLMSDLFNVYNCGMKIRNSNSLSEHEDDINKKNVSARGSFKKFISKLEKKCLDNKIVYYDKDRIIKEFTYYEKDEEGNDDETKVHVDEYALIFAAKIDKYKKICDENKNLLLNVLNLINEWFYVTDENETAADIIKKMIAVVDKKQINVLSKILYALDAEADNYTIRKSKRFNNEVVIDDLNNPTLTNAKEVFYLELKEEAFKSKPKQTVLALNNEDELNEYLKEYSKHLLGLNEAYEIATEKIFVSQPLFVGTEDAEFDRLFAKKYNLENVIKNDEELKKYNYELSNDDRINLLDKDAFTLLYIEDNNLIENKKELEKCIGKINDAKIAKEILSHTINDQIGDTQGLKLDRELYLKNDKDNERKKLIGISYSKLDVIRQCPYRYALDSIMKIRNVERGLMIPSVLGAIAHKIMELIFDVYNLKKKNTTPLLNPSRNRMAKEEYIFKLLKDDTLKNVVNNDSKSKDKNAKDNKKEEKQKYDDHLEFLFDDRIYSAYLKTIIKATLNCVEYIFEDATVKHNYKNIENEVDLSKIDLIETDDYIARLEGFIDRIDYNEGGNARILDYKTGAIPSPITCIGYHLQMYIYNLAYNMKYDKLNIVSQEFIPLLGGFVERKEITRGENKGMSYLQLGQYDNERTIFINDSIYKGFKSFETNYIIDQESGKEGLVDDDGNELSFDKSDYKKTYSQNASDGEINDTIKKAEKSSKDKYFKMARMQRDVVEKYDLSNLITDKAYLEYDLKNYSEREKTLEEVKKLIKDECDLINSGEFKIDPLKGEILEKLNGCKYCEYRLFCKYNGKENK